MDFLPFNHQRWPPSTILALVDVGVPLLLACACLSTPIVVQWTYLTANRAKSFVLISCISVNGVNLRFAFSASPQCIGRYGGVLQM